MNPPDGHNRSGEAWAATVNDPETAEEVREALAIALAESAALRDEIRRQRTENVALRAKLAAVCRWRRLGAALAEELERALSAPQTAQPPHYVMDGETGGASDRAVGLWRLHRTLRAWGLAVGREWPPSATDSS